MEQELFLRGHHDGPRRTRRHPEIEDPLVVRRDGLRPEPALRHLLPLRCRALARPHCGIPVEAKLEGVGEGGVGADTEGVEEPGRVAEAGGAAPEVDARAEGAAAAALPSDGCCGREAEGGRRVRSDCELDGGGDGEGGGGEEDGDDDEESAVELRHGSGGG